MIILTVDRQMANVLFELLVIYNNITESTQVISNYGAIVSPCKTPVTMSKKSVSSSGEQNVAFEFCKASL